MVELRNDPQTLLRYARKLLAAIDADLSSQRLLLIVDQFEELFTQFRSEA